MSTHGDVFHSFTEEEALQEAMRCLSCEDAPCEEDCPSHVPVREFIRNIVFRNYQGAWALIKTANLFGAVCGRVCNANETCKSRCTSKKIVRPIEIDKLQQFVCDRFAAVSYTHLTLPTNREV